MDQAEATFAGAHEALSSHALTQHAVGALVVHAHARTHPPLRPVHPFFDSAPGHRRP